MKYNKKDISEARIPPAKINFFLPKKANLSTIKPQRIFIDQGRAVNATIIPTAVFSIPFSIRNTGRITDVRDTSSPSEKYNNANIKLFFASSGIIF